METNNFEEKQAESIASDLENIFYEIKKVIVGQETMIKGLIYALLAGGHVLLEGPPGLAKTLTLNTLATIINTDFKRIQFTPDLLPADLVGTRIFNQSKGEFTTVLGPIFTNFVLADEINRAPAKVQSALLEAMQEKQVTIGKETYKLKDPFLVMATQNPIESEGTYELPEAQTDRFMLKILVNYPNEQEESTIIERMLGSNNDKLKAILKEESLIEYKEFTNKVYVDPKIIEYIANIVTTTRNLEKNIKIKEYAAYIQYGASPRASLAITQVARARALYKGRTYVTPEDVKKVANACLRHRLILSYEGLAESLTTDNIIDKIVENTKCSIKD